MGRMNCVRLFPEVSRNSYSIAVIFGKDMGNLNKSKIIGLDQGFLKWTKSELRVIIEFNGREGYSIYDN